MSEFMNLINEGCCSNLREVEGMSANAIDTAQANYTQADVNYQQGDGSIAAYGNGYGIPTGQIPADNLNNGFGKITKDYPIPAILPMNRMLIIAEIILKKYGEMIKEIGRSTGISPQELCDKYILR